MISSSHICCTIPNILGFMVWVLWAYFWNELEFVGLTVFHSDTNKNQKKKTTHISTDKEELIWFSNTFVLKIHLDFKTSYGCPASNSCFLNLIFKIPQIIIQNKLFVSHRRHREKITSENIYVCHVASAILLSVWHRKYLWETTG